MHMFCWGVKYQSVWLYADGFVFYRQRLGNARAAPELDFVDTNVRSLIFGYQNLKDLSKHDLLKPARPRGRPPFAARPPARPHAHPLYIYIYIRISTYIYMYIQGSTLRKVHQVSVRKASLIRTIHSYISLARRFRSARGPDLRSTRFAIDPNRGSVSWSQPWY